MRKHPISNVGHGRYDDGAHAPFEIRAPTVVALETKSTVTNDVQPNVLTAVSPIAQLERENCPRQKQRDEIGDNDGPRM